MSLTPTLTAPQPVDRQAAPTDGLSVESHEAGCRSYPGQFAKPTRNRDLPQVPRRTVRSLSAILNRLGEAGPRSADTASVNAVATRPTHPESGRPNLLNSPLPCDELDPLPFVHEGKPWRSGPQSGELPASEAFEGDVAVRHPVCLVTQIGNGLSDAVHSNRRAVDGPGTAYECRLLDVSMSGIAIHSAWAFERGSVLQLEIRTAASGRTIETRGTVVRSEPSRGEGYQIVCRLERYFQFAEIHAIGHDLFAFAIV